MNWDQDFESGEDDGLFDPNKDEYGEDFKIRKVGTLRITFDEMEEAPFREDALMAEFKGILPQMLSMYGLCNSTDIVKVEAILDQYYPTVYHKMDALYKLMQQELAKRCLGNDIRALDENDNEILESAATATRKLQVLALLHKITESRLRVQPMLKEPDIKL